MLIATLLSATACTASDKAPNTGNAPSDVKIVAVNVREAIFNPTLNGQSQGLEFELVRCGGGFPVRGNTDPVLMVGEQAIARHRFTKDGIVFMTGDRDALPNGGRIVVRWGDGPDAPAVDTGEVYNPSAVQSLAR